MLGGARSNVRVLMLAAGAGFPKSEEKSTDGAIVTVFRCFGVAVCDSRGFHYYGQCVSSGFEG